jgi:hypothetical protein
MYAGQERHFWLTLRVPTGQLHPVDLGSTRVRYALPSGQEVVLASALGSVEVVEDRAAWVASIDPEVWGRSVVEEEYNGLRAEVARHVQNGDQQAALSAIQAYRTRNFDLNRSVGSVDVIDNDADLTALEADLNRQFQGADQAARQNLWAKGTRSTAYQARRRGQSRSWASSASSASR